MPESGENELATRIRRLIETHDLAAAMTAPLEESIRVLLETSAAQLDSDEASVLLRDRENEGLVFLVAIGKVAGQLTGMTVPAGKGIAGFVLMSGQPMAVSDAEGDETFYAEVDRATGYSTQSILALPLRFRDEIVGVLEYVNRRGDPPFKPFTPDEMDIAAIYADAIAALVNAYEGKNLLAGLARKTLGEAQRGDIEALRKWLADVRGSEAHREQMDLALLVGELASRGDSERQLCRKLLESLIEFSDSRNETSYLG